MKPFNWGPKNATLFVMAVGWIVLSFVSVSKGNPPPPPPVLPFEQQDRHDEQLLSRDRAAYDRGELAGRHTAPAGPHSGPGAMGIEPGGQIGGVTCPAGQFVNVVGSKSVCGTPTPSADTCTGIGPCLIGYGGMATDGGFYLNPGTALIPAGQGQAMSFGAGSALIGRIWGGVAAPSSTNWALDMRATTTDLSAVTTLFLSAGGVDGVSMSATQILPTLPLVTSITAGSALATSSATYPLVLGSALNDATASPTVSAFKLQPTNAFTAGDGVFEVNQSDSTNLLRCFQGGGCKVGGSTVVTAGTITFPWSTYCEKANCTKAEGAADSFLMPMRDVSGATARIYCNWRTAGTNSGNTTGVVVAIFNQTDATELCSCSLGATSCNTASGVVTTCNCSGTLVGGKSYVMRLKATTDCGTIPGLIGCTTTIAQ